MQKVVDYILIVKGNPGLLADEVKQRMEDDWVPSGPVVVYGDLLVQAMVKFEEV